MRILFLVATRCLSVSASVASCAALDGESIQDSSSAHMSLMQQRLEIVRRPEQRANADSIASVASSRGSLANSGGAHVSMSILASPMVASRWHFRVNSIWDLLRGAQHHLVWKMLEVLSVLAFIACVGVWFLEAFITRLYSEAVVIAIEAIADELIGTDIDVQSKVVSVLGGRVQLFNLKVQNPPGWSEAGILHVDEFEIRLNFFRVLRNRVLRRSELLELDVVALRGVNIKLEKSVTSSNVHDVLAILKGKIPKSEKKEEHSATLKDVVAGSLTANMASGHEQFVNRIEVILRCLEIKYLFATVPGLGSIRLPDASYDDFDQDHAAQVRKLRSIMTQVMVNIFERLIQELESKHTLAKPCCLPCNLALRSGCSPRSKSLSPERKNTTA